MEAKKLYEMLEKDFIKSGITDDWIKFMKHTEFISDNFKARSMGVVCDNSEEIKRVFTAVFPTDSVLRRVGKTNDSLLFLHHPEIWDITKAPQVFQEMNQKILERLRRRRVSVYNLHAALDNFGPYSTSVTFAKRLGLKGLKPFASYNGGMAGVYGTTNFKTSNDLARKFKQVVGHRVLQYQNSGEKIRNRRVAVVAGGGNDIEILREVSDLGINTFATGITALNSHSQLVHDYAREKGINILGGTHYSTEKFACIETCKYFRKLGLSCSFIAGKPGLEDL